MGLLDIFNSSPSQSSGLLQDWQSAYGIDPDEVRRQALQQALLQGAAGVLQGNNLGTGLASGLLNFGQGYGQGKQGAMEQGVLNYKMKSEIEKQKRAQEAQQGILASLKGMMGAPTPPQPTTSAPSGGFDIADKFVAGQEGGYVENDAGHGPTNFGINQQAHPNVFVAKLTPDRAREIRHDEYWQAIGGDSLPQPLAMVAYDSAINQGVGTAKKLLEESGGDPQKFIELRRQAYADLASSKPEQYGQYLAGWNKRLDDLSAAVGTQPAAMPGSTTQPMLSTQDQALISAELQAAMASDDPNAALMQVMKHVQELQGKDRFEIRTVNGRQVQYNTATGQYSPMPGDRQEKTSSPQKYIYPDGHMETLDGATQQDKIDAALAAGAQVVPDSFGVPIPGGSVPKEVFDNEQSLRKEFKNTPEVKSYEAVIPIIDSAYETLGRDTTASDLNLVYALGKVMDPNSVVREGETIMINNAQSPANKLAGYISYLEGGAKFTPALRQQLIAELQSRATALQTQYDQTYEQFAGTASAYGLNSDRALGKKRQQKPIPAPAQVNKQQVGDPVPNMPGWSFAQ